MEKIIDEKTCMRRLESDGRTANNRWKAVTSIIDGGGKLRSADLEAWFKHRTITAKPDQDASTREHHLMVKAAYGMLQVSCVATDGNRVGVFLRPEREKPTGIKKITSGFSVLRSWSPHGTGPKEIQADFARRTGFRCGAPLTISPFGLGYNELAEGPQNLGAGYFFIIFKALCKATDFPSEEQGETESKSGERFIGFFDPVSLHTGVCSHQDEPITFQQRMDHLVVRSLASGERKVSSGVLGAFNQDAWVSTDAMTFGTADPAGSDAGFLRQAMALCCALGKGVVQSAVYDAIKGGGIYLFQ